MVRLTMLAAGPCGSLLAGLRMCLVMCLVMFDVACGRGGPASLPTVDDGRAALAVETSPRSSASRTCAHAACAEDYFIDVAATGRCATGAACTLALTLVATGDYHINDEYPYRFKAEPASGVEFLGTDAAGKNVFSKAARNWKRSGEKTGTMAVVFRPEEAAPDRPADGAARNKSIGGVFKLSVCSAQNCRLEQEELRATVDVF